MSDKVIVIFKSNADTQHVWESDAFSFSIHSDTGNENIKSKCCRYQRRITILWLLWREDPYVQVYKVDLYITLVHFEVCFVLRFDYG